MLLPIASRRALAQTSRRTMNRRLQQCQSGSRRFINDKYIQSTIKHQGWTRPTAVATAVVAAFALLHSPSDLREAQAEVAAPQTEITIEKRKKKKGASKEENRDLISSQHLQVKRSWENPGLYAWGSNAGKVAAPDSEEAYIRTPRRIPYFDDLLLRDIKLDQNFGAAVKENGDLVQWGKGYSAEHTQPTVTLRGKDLKSIAISRDRPKAFRSFMDSVLEKCFKYQLPQLEARKPGLWREGDRDRWGS